MKRTHFQSGMQTTAVVNATPLYTFQKVTAHLSLVFISFVYLQILAIIVIYFQIKGYFQYLTFSVCVFLFAFLNPIPSFADYCIPSFPFLKFILPCHFPEKVYFKSLFALLKKSLLICISFLVSTKVFSEQIWYTQKMSSSEFTNLQVTCVITKS